MFWIWLICNIFVAKYNYSMIFIMQIVCIAKTMQRQVAEEEVQFVTEYPFKIRIINSEIMCF